MEGATLDDLGNWDTWLQVVQVPEAWPPSDLTWRTPLRQLQAVMYSPKDWKMSFMRNKGFSFLPDTLE